MADGTVGVRQASAPDRLIDNETLTVDGQTVYRQRVRDPEVIALLDDVKAAVEGTLAASISGTITLDAATLAALETVNAVVSGAVTVSGPVALDAATLAALEATTVSGTVALDAPTLAALETITATVAGAVALDAPTLAALESITATIAGTVTVTGTVELGATSLAALETISVANFPADFPDTATHSRLDSILTELGQKLEAGGEVALSAASLAALESISATVSNFPADYPATSTVTALDNILTELGEKLEPGGEVALSAATLAALETISTIVTNWPTDYPAAATTALLTALYGRLGATPAVSVTGTVEANLRPLTLVEDSVRQTHRPMTPYSATATGPLTDEVLVAVGAGERIRVLKNSGHCDPATGEGIYPVVTLKIGSTTVYLDKLESGLPWNEAVCFEGTAGDDLTLSLTGSSAVYINIRYELFGA